MKNLNKDQQHRMAQGTTLILGALLLAVLAVLVITTFPDWDSVVTYGGYSNAHL